MKKATVYFVIPCYNEEPVLAETSKRLADKFGRMLSEGLIAPSSRVLFVDDGSRDRSWEMICQLKADNEIFAGIKLAHNKGHQHALLAGLMTAMKYCDAAISMDADLQDDIEVLSDFVEKYNAGCEVVYGVRKKRDTDSFFKRNTALAFYKLMSVLGTEVVYNHADYRLLGSKALDALSQYKEVNLFLRGIVTEIGFKTDFVFYDRGERFAGESKYPFKKMLSFALNGITSFSVKPLKLISSLGMIIAFLSILGILYALISKMMGVAVAGWTAIVSSLWFLGGIQLLSLGVVGEYIGKIYSEIKQRPRFIIEEMVLVSPNDNEENAETTEHQ